MAPIFIASCCSAVSASEFVIIILWEKNLAHHSLKHRMRNSTRIWSISTAVLRLRVVPCPWECVLVLPPDHAICLTYNGRNRAIPAREWTYDRYKNRSVCCRLSSNVTFCSNRANLTYTRHNDAPRASDGICIDSTVHFCSLNTSLISCAFSQTGMFDGSIVCCKEKSTNHGSQQQIRVAYALCCCVVLPSRSAAFLCSQLSWVLFRTTYEENEAISMLKKPERFQR